jgi:hypothetical protein
MTLGWHRSPGQADFAESLAPRRCAPGNQHCALVASRARSATRTTDRLQAHKPDHPESATRRPGTPSATHLNSAASCHPHRGKLATASHPLLPYQDDAMPDCQKAQCRSAVPGCDRDSTRGTFPYPDGLKERQAAGKSLWGSRRSCWSGQSRARQGGSKCSASNESASTVPVTATPSRSPHDQLTPKEPHPSRLARNSSSTMRRRPVSERRSTASCSMDHRSRSRPRTSAVSH